MALLLGLLVLCLGCFFLSVFFQVAKMERRMLRQAHLLEKHLGQRYGVGDAPTTAE